MAELTVVIPIRAMPDRDIAERIGYCIRDPLLERDRVVFMVVDDGSPEEAHHKHRERCEKLGIQYLYLPTRDTVPNMARARNAGVAAARSEYIMFMDVDLHPCPGYYNALLAEIEVQRLTLYSDDMIMTGVVYLTKAGSERFLEIDPDHRCCDFLKALERQKGDVIEKVSTGTSVTLLRRERYLELSGYDESFEQWGYEDLEFNLRAMYRDPKFPLPGDFTEDIGSFQDIDMYRGWKSMYRLYGDMTLAKAIMLFHIWHPVDKNSAYILGYEKNRQKFVRKIKKLAKEPRSTRVRIGRDSPLFERYRGPSRRLTLEEQYRNSPFLTLLQPLKKIPVIGDIFAYVKRRLL